MGRVMTNEQLAANGGFVNRVNLSHSEKLADVLTRNKFAAAEVPGLDDHVWQVSASLAEVPYPSDEVKQLVFVRMQTREALEGQDPIAELRKSGYPQ